MSINTNFTFQKNTKVHNVWRIIALFTVSLSMFYLTISFVLAQDNEPQADKANSLCTKTAKAAQNACENAVEKDYWTVVGKCNNLGSPAEIKACKQQAQQNRRDNMKECAEQFTARRKDCAALGENAYNPIINPANFVESITNPFFPLIPGTTYVYRGGDEVNTVTVTDKTKVIEGVKCIVVRDVVAVNGEVVEDTLDFYAQDIQGNVWYFGETVQDFENGDLVSIAGSFQAGRDGAKPGIIMKANPQVGDIYRQEFLLGEAEDLAEVTSVKGSETVPVVACNNGCLVTKEFSPLAPGVVENKYYVRGIGFILVINPETGERVELVEITKK